MRRDFILSAAFPTFTVELPFIPSTIIVLNNTDKSIYLAIGNTRTPSAVFFDREILPTSNGIPSNVALPNNSYQFAGFLPTPTDPTKTVTVTFQGTADPFSNKPSRSGGNKLPLGASPGNHLMDRGAPRHYREYRLNAVNEDQVMDLPFVAEEVFVLNNSDASLYLSQGGTNKPTPTYYDLTLPSKSYTILEPHGGWNYAALLNNPSEKDCFIIFTAGYADDYAQYPVVQWNFDYNFNTFNFCTVLDFTADQNDFLVGDMTGANPNNTQWIAGVGFRSSTGLRVHANFGEIAGIYEVDIVYQHAGGFLAFNNSISLYLGGIFIPGSTRVVSGSHGNGIYTFNATWATDVNADGIYINLGSIGAQLTLKSANVLARACAP